MSTEEVADYIIADSKLYSESNAENLGNIRFVTRVPASIKKVGEVTTDALLQENWQELDRVYRYQKFTLTHYSIEQRWIVVFSDEAFRQAEHTLQKAKEKEENKFKK